MVFSWRTRQNRSYKTWTGALTQIRLAHLVTISVRVYSQDAWKEREEAAAVFTREEKENTHRFVGRFNAPHFEKQLSLLRDVPCPFSPPAPICHLRQTERTTGQMSLEGHASKKAPIMSFSECCNACLVCAHLPSFFGPPCISPVAPKLGWNKRGEEVCNLKTNERAPPLPLTNLLSCVPSSSVDRPLGEKNRVSFLFRSSSKGRGGNHRTTHSSLAMLDCFKIA